MIPSTEVAGFVAGVGRGGSVCISVHNFGIQVLPSESSVSKIGGAVSMRSHGWESEITSRGPASRAVGGLSCTAITLRGLTGTRLFHRDLEQRIRGGKEADGGGRDANTIPCASVRREAGQRLDVVRP